MHDNFQRHLRDLVFGFAQKHGAGEGLRMVENQIASDFVSVYYSISKASGRDLSVMLKSLAKKIEFTASQFEVKLENKVNPCIFQTDYIFAEINNLYVMHKSKTAIDDAQALEFTNQDVISALEKLNSKVLESK